MNPKKNKSTIKDKSKKRNISLSGLMTPPDVFNNPEIPYRAMYLLGKLKQLTNKRLGYSWVSNEALAKMFQVSVGTIQAHITQLEKAGQIHRTCIKFPKRTLRRIHLGRGHMLNAGMSQVAMKLPHYDKYWGYVALNSAFPELEISPGRYGSYELDYALGKYIRSEAVPLDTRKKQLQLLGKQLQVKIRVSREPVTDAQGRVGVGPVELSATNKAGEKVVFLPADSHALNVNKLLQCAGLEVVTFEEELNNTASFTVFEDESHSENCLVCGAEQICDPSASGPSEEGDALRAENDTGACSTVGVLTNQETGTEDTDDCGFPNHGTTNQDTGLLSMNPIGNNVLNDVSPCPSRGQAQRILEPRFTYLSDRQGRDYCEDFIGEAGPDFKLDEKPQQPRPKRSGHGRRTQHSREKREAFLTRTYDSTRHTVPSEVKTRRMSVNNGKPFVLIQRGNTKKDSHPFITIVPDADGRIATVWTHRTRIVSGAKMPEVRNADFLRTPEMSIPESEALMLPLIRTRLEQISIDDDALMFGQLFEDYIWTQRKATQWFAAKRKYKITTTKLRVLLKHRSSFWRPEYEKWTIGSVWRSIMKECGEHFTHWMLVEDDAETWNEFNKETKTAAAAVNAHVHIMGEKDNALIYGKN